MDNMVYYKNKHTNIFIIMLFVLFYSITTCQSFATPSVTDISATNADVGLYAKFELTFNVITTASCLYWPYDESPNNGVPSKVGVSVDGLFSNDNWKTTVVQPGFYYQDFARNDDNLSYMTWLYPKGNPVWKIRFAPTQIGQWKYKIRVIDADGTYYSDESSFNCISSNKHGFVCVSSKDKRYFELSDGYYMPMVGLNYDNKCLKELENSYINCANNLGINLIRSWWQSSNPGFALFGAGGQGGDTYWRNLVYSTDYLPSGHIVVAKIPNSSSPWGALYTQPCIKLNKKYRLSAIVKTVGITGSEDCGVCFIVNGIGKSTPISGDNDWKEITYDFTDTTNCYTATVALGQVNVTSGTAYVASMSLKEDLGDGNYGPELLYRNDFLANVSYPQDAAWRIDHQLEFAEQSGVYIRAVIEEKCDSFYGCIQPDGTWGTQSADNVYANSTHACRTYQQYYWRYLIARYGYSTAIHSFEFCNEGDPFDTNHYDAVKALARYIKSNDPNKHLVSTSTWHSFPPNLWQNVDIDSSDIHMYLGWGVASGGNRLIPGWDGEWQKAYYCSNESDLGTNFSFDETVKHTGKCSLKVSVPPLSPNGGSDSDSIDGGAYYPVDSKLAFMCGVKKGDKIKVSAWVKGINSILCSNKPWKYQGCFNTWYANNGGDYVGTPESFINAPTGTYDWTYVEATWTVTNDNANIMGVKPRYWANNSLTDGATIWWDDICIQNLTTGQTLNYNGGFEYTDSESYDVVAGHCAYSRLTHSFNYGKPTVRGEVGFCYPQRFTNPYKGFSYTGEDQLLIDDTNGVWWKKWVWAQLDADGLYEIYWWPQLLLQRGYTYGKAFQNFMSGIPLSNGNYVDVSAVVSNDELRVLGQKDLTNNKAHLWIDNIPYNWKNVVDGVNIPTVSGTVTVSGFKDGDYKAEWWNTATGTITNTEDVACSGGNIILSVKDLQSDIACKIYPVQSQSQANIKLRILVPSDQVKPGEIVTVTVEYTNTSAVPANNIVVLARIPAEMDYVTGTAETSGGAYDAATKTIRWTIANIDAGQTGTKTYQAKVQ